MEEELEKGNQPKPFQTQEYLDDFAHSNEFFAAIQTSAKTGHNITQMFAQLVREIIKHDLEQAESGRESSPSVRLTMPSPGKEKKKGCCK